IVSAVAYILAELIWDLEAINLAPVTEICRTGALSFPSLQLQRQVCGFINEKGDWSSALWKDLQNISVFGLIVTKILNPPCQATTKEMREAGKICRRYFVFKVCAFELLHTAILIDDPT